jgi:hypothetical protein
MTQVTLDAATTAKLQGAGEPVELRDDTGRILGHFHPVPRDAQGRLWCPLSDEEIEERSRQEGGRSWDEIRADLSKL